MVIQYFVMFKIVSILYASEIQSIKCIVYAFAMLEENNDQGEV